MKARARIEAYFAACNGGDAAAVAANFTADGRIYDTNHAPVMGREAIGAFWARIAKKWAGARWQIDSLVEDDDAAAIEWTMTGRHDGRPFAVRGSEHYAFEDGLIKEIRQYWSFDPVAPGSELQGYDYGVKGC